jgi:lipopolysaccharide export system permease protein
MTLDRYLLKLFFPILLAALVMFVLLFSLIDLFANLWRYIANGAQIIQILRVSLFYLPKCVSYSLPVSLLFAASYSLGDLYAKNELTVISTSGIPLWRFTVSLIVFGILISIGFYYFDDSVVIPTYAQKTSLSRELLQQNGGLNNSDVVIISEGGKLVYSVDYYNDADRSLHGVLILERDESLDLVSLIRARQARWVQSRWVLDDGTKYFWSHGILTERPYFEEGRYTEDPGTFRRSAVNVEELKTQDAILFIEDLKRAGFPYFKALSDYYRRFAFSVTPLVVLLLSIPMGGRFSKNILLMSLLASLIAAVIYYVAQMVTMMFAKLGYLDPLWGAWAPVIFFIGLGILFIRTART